jgi:phage shock protein A
MTPEQLEVVLNRIDNHIVTLKEMRANLEELRLKTEELETKLQDIKVRSL